MIVTEELCDGDRSGDFMFALSAVYFRPIFAAPGTPL